jgi:DNA (cytosine-5)-methyltransferase 1
MEFRLGELFCGPGGLALGAINPIIKNGNDTYNVIHCWSNDYDIDSCKTFSRNIVGHETDSVICEDVRKLNISNLKPIDAFAYGFPCNDFSVVGKQKGFNGEFGPLYTYGIQIMDKLKPLFFVAENVGGLASSNSGNSFKKILYDLERCGNGYNLVANLYKAELYGIPQTRHRIIIVGISKTLNKVFKVPAPTTPKNYKTAYDALMNPPIEATATNNEVTKQSDIVIERLKHIKPGENVWTAKLPQKLKLNVKAAKLSQIYKRLDPNKPSYTITGSGGGGTHGYHWAEPRALTNRERARIQTFPDNFIFEGSKESVRKQIGMAVPPKLAEIIFTAILKTMAGVKYDSVSANINLENNSIFGA